MRRDDCKYAVGPDSTMNGLIGARAEPLLAALEHIVRTCKGSRTQTRRIRYIEEVAMAAIEGRKVNANVGVPRGAPAHPDLSDAASR